MPNRATAAAISVAISAIVVDDEKLASDELSYQLREFPDVEVIATASNGIEAVQFFFEPVHALALVVDVCFVFLRRSEDRGREFFTDGSCHAPK